MSKSKFIIRSEDEPSTSRQSDTLLAINAESKKTKRVKVPLIDGEVEDVIQEELDRLYGLGKYRHPNIAALFSIQRGPKSVNGKSTILFLHFESSGLTLGEYLLEGLDAHTVKDLMHQVMRGLDFLHKQGIVHGDMRPRNLIITPDGGIKITDFGLKETLAYDRINRAEEEESLAYKSPEILLGSYSGTASDVWASGCILAEMYMCTALFEGSSLEDRLDNIFSVIGTPRKEEWPKDVMTPHKLFPLRPRISFSSIIPEICREGCDLLNSLLRFDHGQRLGVGQVLHHPYFSYKSYMLAARISTEMDCGRYDSTESE
ncbi:hypothetical protein AAG570_003697 [Ranatra chinensis]|uniref:Protein kinase domain-containing protein n=1 Tax=Ranatra chinensis TaxID=642074 RepID=A0ABD0YGU5_9HEMI